MRASRILLLFAGALTIAGCDDDGGVTTTVHPPVALTRFVAAVHDRAGTDWRFIDQLEYSPPAFNLTFRGFTPYQQTLPGTRHLRIFPTSDDIAVTRQALVDTTLTFVANVYYTIVFTPYAADGVTRVNRVVVTEDNFQTLAEGQIAIRALNLGTGRVSAPAGPIDVFSAASAGAALPGASLFSGVGYGAVTAYNTRGTGALALRAMPAGATVSPAVANALAPAGAAGDPSQNLTTIGGTGMSGSSILGILVPGSTVGSTAPQTAAFVAVTTDATLSATATGYSRSQGSFISDGFTVDQQLTVNGFTDAANNGTSVITAVQDFQRTGSITLSVSPAGYARTTGSFITDGFTVGMDVYAIGFEEAENNGPATVTAVTALLLTVAKVPALVTEAAASGRSVCADPCSTVTVTKTPATVDEGRASGRRLRAPRPAWIYMIDRHPR